MNVFDFKGVKPRIGDRVFIAPNAYVIGDVEVKDEASIWFGTIVRGDVNYIRIGKKTNIQDLSMIHVTTAKYPTIIGDFVTVGHKAMIHGCVIGNYCLIGMAAVILDGVELSDYTIVAAGSLIPPGKRFPEGVLLKGAPAKVAREITEDERLEIERLAEHYYQLAQIYMTKNL